MTHPDGNEGVAGAQMPDPASADVVFMPLIGADRARIESLRSYAETIRRATGYPIRLKVFSGGQTIEELA